MLSTLENRLPPPILVMVLAGLMAVGARIGPTGALPEAYRTGLAALCFLAAGLFGFPAIRAFIRAKTTINPVAITQASSLVVGGIYRVTRNPMYVALTLLLCAWACWLGTAVAALGPMVFAAFIDRFQIVPEERALQARFGAEYAAYRLRVRRWL